ncbi:hypothetical protein [Streptomyces sp. SID11385]|uniref:hypothetical protein n=1 Tax=Streptomyces sp. SID11385 TaxID=2706031 RepID=UPI0013C6725C|nr:hypothetical protein [Streptomyces sp. SID11385]NEA39268.1 hypothetical protein [Streptomyces sp. SID11385]
MPGMSGVVIVRPAVELRRDFARWAVAQRPKVRTASPTSFAVPAVRFTEAPEEILIGSFVDGQRYVSPDEDTPECTVGRPELVGVASPDGYREAVPGEPLPEVPAEVYGPDSTPLPEGSDDSDSSAEAPEGVFPCGACDREFTSERGRDAHGRQKHAEA